MTYSYSSGLVRRSLTTGTSKNFASLSMLCRRCASLAGMLLRSKSIVSSLPMAPPILLKLIIVICTYLTVWGGFSILCEPTAGKLPTWITADVFVYAGPLGRRREALARLGYCARVRWLIL